MEEKLNKVVQSFSKESNDNMNVNQCLIKIEEALTAQKDS
jgi:hypothetical protein